MKGTLLQYGPKIVLADKDGTTTVGSLSFHIANRIQVKWTIDTAVPNRFLLVGPQGSRNAALLCDLLTGRVTTGCFEGTLDELELENDKNHRYDRHGEEYRALLQFLRAMMLIRAPWLKVTP